MSPAICQAHPTVIGHEVNIANACRANRPDKWGKLVAKDRGDSSQTSLNLFYINNIGAIEPDLWMSWLRVIDFYKEHGTINPWCTRKNIFWYYRDGLNYHTRR